MSVRVAVILVPLAIALGAVPLIENMNLIMRPLLGIAIVAGFVMSQGQLRPAERLWSGLLAFYMVALMLSSLGSVAPDAVAVNLGRQAFVMLLSIALVVLYRDPAMRRTALKSLLFILVAAAGLTAWVYLTLGPQYGLSYEGTRLIKGTALADYGIGLNTLSYLSVIALLGVRVAYRPGALADALLLGAGLLCIFLLGSRATLLALLLSWLVFAILTRAWRISPALSLLAMLVMAGLAVLGWMIVASYAVEIRDIFGADVLREISVGRTDMWAAGLRLWSEHPLFGWGPESWKMLLLEYLPGASERTLYVIANLESGSFHNGFVTVLAERGAVGLLAAVAMQLYLFFCAASVYADRERLPEEDRRMAGILPILVLFMFIRSLAESSGLFGNANGEVDYLTYILCSYLVALRADCLRQRQNEIENYLAGSARPVGVGAAEDAASSPG